MTEIRNTIEQYEITRMNLCERIKQLDEQIPDAPMVGDLLNRRHLLYSEVMDIEASIAQMTRYLCNVAARQEVCS